LRSFPMPPKRCFVLAVNDLLSILDAARKGVSIIGTDAVRRWSRDGMALCLDLKRDKTAQDGRKDCATFDGMMDLADERHTRESSPLLPGCRCIACRPRTNHTSSGSCKDKIEVPSFSRAYIHHLIKAKEMLAETLLFVHNLHQVLLLFRQLSDAASLDESGHNCGKENFLESFCQKIEEHLHAGRPAAEEYCKLSDIRSLYEPSSSYTLLTSPRSAVGASDPWCINSTSFYTINGTSLHCSSSLSNVVHRLTSESMLAVLCFFTAYFETFSST